MELKLDVLVAVGSVIADSHRHVFKDASAEPSGSVRINELKMQIESTLLRASGMIRLAVAAQG